MKFFGYPDKITRLLQALYKQSQSTVRVNGDLTDWFATTVGVRQGCVLSPQLFNILLELVMLYATHEVCIGANIQGKQINNLRFADDIVLMAESADDLQVLVDRVQDSSCNFGLKINIAKTEVQAISKQKINLCITINGTQLKQVEDFIYLGGTISEGGSCTKDIQHRIGKALGAVQALHNIWRSNEITNPTKVELYKVLILSILLYGAETWTLKKVDANRLQTFEMMCLRKILGVTRMDKIKNTSIRQTLGIKNTITELVANKRLRYFGHVKRMSSTRNPNLVLGSHVHGHRPRGRPAKRWEDCVRSDCQERGLRKLTDACRLCRDRKTWQDIMDQKPSHSPQLVWTA